VVHNRENGRTIYRQQGACLPTRRVDEGNSRGTVEAPLRERPNISGGPNNQNRARGKTVQFAM